MNFTIISKKVNQVWILFVGTQIFIPDVLCSILLIYFYLNFIFWIF